MKETERQIKQQATGQSPTIGILCVLRFSNKGLLEGWKLNKLKKNLNFFLIILKSKSSVFLQNLDKGGKVTSEPNSISSLSSSLILEQIKFH